MARTNKNTVMVSLRMRRETVRVLKLVAKERGIGYQTLANQVLGIYLENVDDVNTLEGRPSVPVDVEAVKQSLIS